MYSWCFYKKKTNSKTQHQVIFKNFYSNLARNLLAKIFKEPNQYTINFVSDQTINFLSLNYIVYDYQFCFRKNHPTVTFLSFLNGRILKGFNDGLLTVISLIGVQKTFDSINCNILLRNWSIICFFLMFLFYGFNLIYQIKNLL